MFRNIRKSVVAFGLLAVWSVCRPVAAQQAPTPQPVPVNVQNTPNVNVANMPNVNVANMPSVSLEAGASVAVTSPPDGQGNPTPIAVLDAFQVYEDSCQIVFSGAQFGSCEFHAVPADKQLVVQVFTAIGEMESGIQPAYSALYRQGSMVVHYFPTFRTSSFANLDSFVSNGETRIYMPPNVTPTCASDLTAPSGLGVYQCSLSGYLVDASVVTSGGTAPAQNHQRALAPLVRNSGGARQPGNSGR